jgi:hypothetical protein
MIEVRIPFRDAYTNDIGYVESQLMAAGFPPYAVRTVTRGMMKHWWEYPPGDFIYQWIPYEEYSQANPQGEPKGG